MLGWNPGVPFEWWGWAVEPAASTRFNSRSISASTRTVLPFLCLHRSLVLSFPNNIISLWSLLDPGKLKRLCYQQGIKFPFFFRDLECGVFLKKKTKQQNTQWGKHSGKLVFFMCRPNSSLPFNNWNAIRKIQLWFIRALLWRSVSQGVGKEVALHQFIGLQWMCNLQLLSGCFLVFS